MPSVSPLRFILPQLASPVDQPPEGGQWIHEIKYDGYRCQVLLEPGRIRVLTRNGYDWTDRYPSIVRAASKIRCQSANIDGEAIVQDGDGASDFDSLNSAMRWRPESMITSPVVSFRPRLRFAGENHDPAGQDKAVDGLHP
jgi:ATP-dependent DNA ligase